MIWGHKLTFKIKSLDQEIGNVNKTLDYVTNIQLLKITSTKQIMPLNTKIGNWPLNVYILSIQKSSELISGKYASVVIPSTELPELPTVAIAN